MRERIGTRRTLTYRFAAAGPGCVEHQGPYFAAQMLNDGITWAAFIQQSVETFKFVGIPFPVRHHECACSGDNIFYHSTCGCETYISMRCGKMPKHCEHMPLRVGSGGCVKTQQQQQQQQQQNVHRDGLRKVQQKKKAERVSEIKRPQKQPAE